KPTTEGVRFEPCSLGMTLTSLPSMMATTEFVVPRSMPTILPMGRLQYVPAFEAQTVCQSSPQDLSSSYWPTKGCERIPRGCRLECQSDRGGMSGMFSDRWWIVKAAAALGLLAWLCQDTHQRLAALYPDVERVALFSDSLR